MLPQLYTLESGKIDAPYDNSALPRVHRFSWTQDDTERAICTCRLWKSPRVISQPIAHGRENLQLTDTCVIPRDKRRLSTLKLPLSLSAGLQTGQWSEASKGNTPTPWLASSIALPKISRCGENHADFHSGCGT